MHIKRYTLGAILLIAAVVTYVHKMVTEAEYSLDILGIHVTLPIAAWVAVPMVILYLASVFHMAYYGFKGYLRKKRVSKDIEKLADAVSRAILKAPRKHNYFDKRVKPVGAALDNGCDDLSKIDKKAVHEQIRDAIDTVSAIKHGEVLDLGRYKLDKSNPYAVQNALNLLKNEPERAEEVLRRAPYYDRKVLKEAMRIFVEGASGAEIEKFQEFVDKEILFHLLESMGNRSDKNAVSLRTVEKLLENIEMDACDYLLMARHLIKQATPNELIAFFEKLSTREERAFRGYLFTLLEFEMLDRVNEILQDTQPDEYPEFKAYLDLRKNGKHYPIDMLLYQC